MEMVYLVNFPSKNATKGQEFNGTPELEKELLERGIIGNGEITIEKDNSNSNELLEIIDSLKKEIEEKNDFIKNSESEELKSLVEKQKLEIDEKAKNIDGLMVVIEELKSLVEEAIKSKQGQIPEGFVKYKES